MQKKLAILFLVLAIGCGKKAETVENPATKDTMTDAMTTQTPPQVASTDGVFEIIQKNDSIPGSLNTATIQKLDKSLQAVAAFYAAMGGTLCEGETCGLTTALGLGKQGSEAHKKLIQQYFPGDKVATTVVAQDCYLRPSGALTFTDFQYLTITRKGTAVAVDYSLMQYNQGAVSYTKGPDHYTFQNGSFQKMSRNLWKFAEE